MLAQDLQRSLDEEKPSLSIGVKVFFCGSFFPRLPSKNGEHVFDVHSGGGLPYS